MGDQEVDDAEQRCAGQQMVGDTATELTPDGVIGLDLFGELTAAIDLPGQQLRLSHTALAAGDAHVTPFHDHNGSPAITIEAAGTAMSADVDTGGPAALSVRSADAVRLAGTPTAVGKGRTATNEFTILGAPLAGTLIVAGWTQTNPEVTIVEAIPATSIGAAFLPVERPRRRSAA